MSSLNEGERCEANCGKPHVWMEWYPLYEGYRRKCALLGCIAHQDQKGDLMPEGLLDLGIFFPERQSYDLTPKGCSHMWEPWYWNNHGMYNRKCYYCNWWQETKNISVSGGSVKE